MIFKTIKMTNFGPYKGEQVIEFPEDSNKPVIFIYGENMRGKTSILNAVRWAMYEEALDRHLRDIETINLFNTSSIDSGERFFSVSLEFKVDDNDYELTRKANLHSHIITPRKSSDFEISVYLKENGKAVPSDTIEKVINDFIPKEISRFYLFDAELLTEYEKLLSIDNEQNKVIKEGIEKILGVPALAKGKSEATVLLKEAQKEQAREANNLNNLKAKAKNIENLTKELERVNKDLAKDKDELEKLNQQMEAVENKLNENSEYRKSSEKLKELKIKKDNVLSMIETINADKMKTIKNSWKYLISHKLEAYADEINSKIAEIRELENEYNTLINEKKSLEKILDLKDVCPTCNQEVSDTFKQRLEKRLGELDTVISNFKLNNENIYELIEEIRKIDSLKDSKNLDQLNEIEVRLANKNVELIDIENHISNINSELAGYDQFSDDRLMGQKNELLKLIGVAEGVLKDLTKDKQNLTLKIDHLSKEVSGSPEGKELKSTKKVELLRTIETIFTNSIDSLINKLKDTVEENATEAFLNLTTENTYRKLEINQNYGLHIIDQYDNRVNVRSAGAEQIVALSLLAALNRTSNKSAPLIIDTPFARLDPKHRMNILHYVPNMASQILFLVHSGELAKDADIGEVVNYVGARYEITHVSSRESRIIKL
jgi:DNA sulfur modification protein DndD